MRMRIRIQHFRLNTDPDPDLIRIQSGSRVLMTKTWKKFIAGKIFLIFFKSKTTIYISLGLHKGFPSYRRSLQPSKENIQHLKTWNFLIFFYFCGSFLPSWIQIRTPEPDTDPLPLLNPDPIRIRIQNTANKALSIQQSGRLSLCWGLWWCGRFTSNLDQPRHPLSSVTGGQCKFFYKPSAVSSSSLFAVGSVGTPFVNSLFKCINIWTSPFLFLKC
jgi:hypothetical protein